MSEYYESTLELIVNSLREIDMSEDKIQYIIDEIRSGNINISLSDTVRQIRKSILE